MNIIAGTIIGGVVGAIVGGQIMRHIRYKRITKSLTQLEQTNRELRRQSKEMSKWLKATGAIEKC